MDPIKEAFQRAKTDIDSLRAQLADLTQQVVTLSSLLKVQQTTQPTDINKSATQPIILPTQELTEPSKQPFQGLKEPYTGFSTGNEGVPTNQPTNQQTNQHIGNEGGSIKANFSPTHNLPKAHAKNIDKLEKISEILASLDELKKDVRIKFKRLTDQEMAVFTKIYELDESSIDSTYELIAEQLNLTEISIRDYVGKIIAKGVPLEKRKENNKRVLLSIPDDLKRIASLQTIFQLRAL